MLSPWVILLTVFGWGTIGLIVLLLLLCFVLNWVEQRRRRRKVIDAIKARAAAKTRNGKC